MDAGLFVAIGVYMLTGMLMVGAIISMYMDKRIRIAEIEQGWAKAPKFPVEYADSNTINKLRDVLHSSTHVELGSADDVIHQMQNAGILFRERRD